MIALSLLLLLLFSIWKLLYYPCSNKWAQVGQEVLAVVHFYPVFYFSRIFHRKLMAFRLFSIGKTSQLLSRVKVMKKTKLLARIYFTKNQLEFAVALSKALVCRRRCRRRRRPSRSPPTSPFTNISSDSRSRFILPAQCSGKRFTRASSIIINIYPSSLLLLSSISSQKQSSSLQHCWEYLLSPRL